MDSNIKSWIINKLIENNRNRSIVYSLYDLFKKETGSFAEKRSYQSYVYKLDKSLQYNDLDEVIGEDMNLYEDNSEDEFIKSYANLQKSNQKLQDKNRVISKAFREKVRLINALEEYNEQLINILSSVNLSNFSFTEISKDDPKFGILHISDAHFNELILSEENINNEYDFKISSKRLKKLVNRAIPFFKSRGVKNVLIVFTGDLLNSDRRLDEKLHMATNRSKATILSVLILEQMILELSKEFGIYAACVTGNESRVGEFNDFSEIVATDNYDFVIFNILKLIFRNTPVTFLEGSYKENLISINGFNLLILHGESIPGSRTHIKIQEIVGKYSQKGIRVHYVLFGHLHSAFISDFFSRGGSLAGANAYSDMQLQLISRASQNAYIVNEDLSVDGIKFDLQNVEGIDGYEIDESLEAYNAISADRCKPKETILRIII